MNDDTRCVLFVGPYRCGTTSVGQALESLGHRDTGWCPDAFTGHTYALIAAFNEGMRACARFDDVPDAVRADVRELLGPPLRASMQGRTCASDWPLGHDCIHPYIRKLIFPGARFIFLERDMDRYVRSVEAHGRATDAYSTDPVFRALWSPPAQAGGAWLARARYETWRAQYVALAHSFPNDVLFMRVQDGWAPLLAFLGLDADVSVGRQFPWLNAS